MAAEYDMRSECMQVPTAIYVDSHQYHPSTSSVLWHFLNELNVTSSSSFSHTRLCPTDSRLNCVNEKYLIPITFYQISMFNGRLLRTVRWLEVKGIQTISLHCMPKRPRWWSLFRIVWIDVLRPVTKRNCFWSWIALCVLFQRAAVVSWYGSTWVTLFYPMSNISCFLESIPYLWNDTPFYSNRFCCTPLGLSSLQCHYFLFNYWVPVGVF